MLLLKGTLYNLLYFFSMEITLFRLSISIGFSCVRLYFPTDLFHFILVSKFI